MILFISKWLAKRDREHLAVLEADFEKSKALLMKCEDAVTSLEAQGVENSDILAVVTVHLASARRVLEGRLQQIIDLKTSLTIHELNLECDAIVKRMSA